MCQVAFQTLHSLQVLHGDPNRHKMIVRADMVKIIDFEDSVLSSDNTLKQEMEGLAAALTETSGKEEERHRYYRLLVQVLGI